MKYLFPLDISCAPYIIIIISSSSSSSVKLILVQNNQRRLKCFKTNQLTTNVFSISSKRE